MKKKKSRRIIALLILIPVIAAVVFAVYNYASRSLQKTLYPLKYEKYVATYCRKYKLEKSFVFAVIKCESGFQSDAVDTTCAGDSFWGGVLTCLSESGKRPEELTLAEAVAFARFGNAVAALCVRKRGAIPAMPDRADVLALLNG